MPPIIRLTDQNDLVETSKYPDYAKFPFEKFNPVQSRVFELYDKDANIVIAAATSAGKTVCAELLLANEIRVRGGKGMYLAPMKALAKEKIDDWSDDKHHFSNLNLSICTGDYQLTPERRKELEASNLVMMTSEMLNSRIRNFKAEQNEWLKSIGTLVVDESHLLAVAGRGDHLEVGLMKFCKLNPNCRIVFLSATMPNVKEISEWVSYVLNKKETYLIESTYRPCPLGIHYETYQEAGTYESNEEEKVSAALRIINDYKDDKFLVFVHTKRTGEMMLKNLKKAGYNAEFHSADLDKTKRHKLEADFRSRKIDILVATSTLAWGCHAYGSLVQMADGTLKKIEEVFVGDRVLSFDGKSFVEDTVINCADKEDNGLIITLSTGEKCNVTNEHLFFSTVGRNSPAWNKVEDLSVGDFIAVPKQYNFPTIDEYNPKGYLFGALTGDGCVCRAGYHASGEEKNLIDICANKNDRYFLSRIKKTLEQELNYKLPKLKPDSNGVLHLVCKAKVASDYFKGVINPGRKYNLSIPSFIQKDRALLRSYLIGLFDTDGGLEDHSNGSWSVGLSNINEKFIRQIQQLLLTFGINSGIGKKKTKDVIINGRFQKGKNDCWRLRIYNENIVNFYKNIGFSHPKKTALLKSLVRKGFCVNRDLFPARRLITEHADLCGISGYKLCKNTSSSDHWTLLNKQDIKTSSLNKLLLEYPAESELNSLANADLLWKKITKIENSSKNRFRDIEIENHHNFVCDGFLSHNCNLPARRVIITGVHRGLNEVDNYDIWQEVGRAGRPGFDPRGDAYILVPHSEAAMYIKKLQTPQKIGSRLLDYVGDEYVQHYKTLAFHLVSEIHHDEIYNRESMHGWYERSLAHFQANDLDDKIVDSTLDLLLKCGAIREEGGEYKVTMVGKIASMFYFSPFDVSDLRRNFKILFDSGQEGNDLVLSMALGNTDTIRMGIVSKVEREEMGNFSHKIKTLFGDKVKDTAIKGAYVYYLLLNGIKTGVFTAMARNLQADYARLNAVLNALDGMSCKWNKKTWFKKTQMRVSYGVKGELVDLCQIADIGKAKAEKLWAAGIKTPRDVVNNSSKVQSILKLKPDKLKEMIASASVVDLF